MPSVGGAFGGAVAKCSGSLMRVIFPECCLKLKLIRINIKELDKENCLGDIW